MIGSRLARRWTSLSRPQRLEADLMSKLLELKRTRKDLVARALEDPLVQPDETVMVGDRDRDILAANRCGVRSVGRRGGLHDADG